MKTDVCYDPRTKTLSIQVLDVDQKNAKEWLFQLVASLHQRAKTRMAHDYLHAHNLMNLEGQIRQALNNPTNDPE